MMVKVFDKVLLAIAENVLSVFVHEEKVARVEEAIVVKDGLGSFWVIVVSLSAACKA